MVDRRGGGAGTRVDARPPMENQENIFRYMGGLFAIFCPFASYDGLFWAYHLTKIYAGAHSQTPRDLT